MNAFAQSTKEDGTPASIEAIGVDMINLLDGLVNGERDPTVRLPLDPVYTKATVLLHLLQFLEAQASLDLLLAQRAEIEAETSPKVSASGALVKEALNRQQHQVVQQAPPASIYRKAST